MAAALDRLPGWNAPRSTTRWAMRGLWVFLALALVIGLLAVLVQTTPLEEYVEPQRDEFPVGEHDDPTVDRPSGGGADDPGAFEDEPGLGQGRHTDPVAP